jgi:hypothetical protein
MKYIKAIVCFVVCTLIACTAFAQETLTLSNAATFSMRAHTTFGYDFAKQQSGLETQFDQVQVWFELFPYATHGLLPNKNNKGLGVSIRAEGLKYAFKWFDSTNAPKDKDAVDTGKHIGDYTESPCWNSNDEYAPGEDASVERLVAEITYHNFYYSIADTDDPIWFTDASMQGIFDELEKKATGGENMLGFPITNFTKDSVKTLLSTFNISGISTAGYRSDTLKASLKAASKGTWETNTNNAWIFGCSADYTPLANLNLGLDALSTVNYTFTEDTTDYHDITQCGLKADYTFTFTDKLALKPYVGFDGEYTQNTFKWEVGTGATFYWRGTAYAAQNDTLNIWGMNIPVGLSLATNINQDKEMNAALSLYEDSADGGFIPHLGGFVEAELKNALAANGKDAQAGMAAQVEYRITKKIRPYLFGEYLQGYTSGKQTGTDGLASRIGILFVPAPHLTIDVRYARADSIGKNTSLDPGIITTKCAIKF